MRVQMGNKLYKMNENQFRRFREAAKQCMPVGIYAVEKDGLAIMMNERPKSSKVLNKQVSDFVKKGFKVYYNGFQADNE